MPKEMTHADYLASPQWRAWDRLVQDIDNDCGGLVKSVQEHLHEDAMQYLEGIRQHLIKAKALDPQMESDGKCLCCGEDGTECECTMTGVNSAWRCATHQRESSDWKIQA